MEIAGLAVGVPGLFTVCLGLIDRVDFYKSFEVDSRQLVARFETSKLRLREWASSVGISDDKLSDGHHTRLDHPEVASVVRTILLSLCEVFEKSEHTRTRLRLPPEQANLVSSPWPILRRNEIDKNKAGLTLSSARSGIAWAVKFRSQFTNQVEMFEILIDRLYDLVPPDRREGQAQEMNDQGDRISGNFPLFTL
jgi:Prion-inhibition and propagation